jgi:hypothetical protein
MEKPRDIIIRRENGKDEQDEYYGNPLLKLERDLIKLEIENAPKTGDADENLRIVGSSSIAGAEEVPVKPRWKRAVRIGLLSLIVTGLTGFGIYQHKAFLDKQNAPLNYLTNQGITPENAKILVQKLNPIGRLTENEVEFVKTIAGYDEDLQRVCVESDILNRKKYGIEDHITAAELKAVKAAALERKVINPKESRAVLIHTLGYRDPSLYSKENTEAAVHGLFDFYRLFKEKRMDDDNITLLIDNPTNFPIPKEVQVDGISTKSNSLKALASTESDSNDNLYVVIASPNPRQEVSVNSSVENRTRIEFSDGDIGSQDLFDVLSRGHNTEGNLDIEHSFNYGKAVVISQTYGAANLWSAIKREGFLDAPGERYLRNMLVIASSNRFSRANNDFLATSARFMRENPDLSPEGLVKRLNQIYPDQDKAQVFYYDLKGFEGIPEEADFYTQPVLSHKL